MWYFGFFSISLEKLNCGFFTHFTREKTPQNNFSSQNSSIENNYWINNNPTFQLKKMHLHVLDISQQVGIINMIKIFYNLPVLYLLRSWILYHRLLTTFFNNEFSWHVLNFHFTHYTELQTWNPLCNFNLEIPFVFEPISRVSVIASISSVIYAYYRSFQICNVLHTPYTNTKSSKSAIYMHKKRVKNNRKLFES